MVWQDCMLGYTDPPEDETFEAAVVGRARGGVRPARAAGRPWPWCAGARRSRSRRPCSGCRGRSGRAALTEQIIPALAGKLLPGVPYVTSSPTGGDLPFQPDAGDCHYWGVGSYLRPPERRPAVRASGS